MRETREETYALRLTAAEVVIVARACEHELMPPVVKPANRRLWRKVRELRDRVVADREPAGAGYRRAKRERRRQT